MTRRGTVVGLSLLCALALCAIAASSAMAVQGTTAFKCVHVGKAATFEDEHCTEGSGVPGGEGFVHQEIPEDEVLDATATNVVTGTAIPAKFKTTIAGVEVELQAKSFHSCKETSIANVRDEKEQMVIGGDYCGEFTKVTVTKPVEKCTVAGNAVKLSEGFYEGRVLKGGEIEEMWFEFRPPQGEPFATFELLGAACPFKNMKFSVEGIAADANVMTKELPLDGATLNFTTKETEKYLEVEGKKAAFEGTFTTYAVEGEEKIPLVATTTES